MHVLHKIQGLMLLCDYVGSITKCFCVLVSRIKTFSFRKFTSCCFISVLISFQSCIFKSQVSKGCGQNKIRGWQDKKCYSQLQSQFMYYYSWSLYKRYKNLWQTPKYCCPSKVNSLNCSLSNSVTWLLTPAIITAKQQWEGKEITHNFKVEYLLR